MTDKLNTFRSWAMAGAEVIDAWRIVPRVILVAYGSLVWYLTQWYLSIETFTKTECSADVLKVLLDKNIPLEQAQHIACTVVDTVGGPTNGYTVLVTTICGLSTLVIGLYHNSSKDWSKSILPWNFGKCKNDKTESNE